MDQLAPNPSGTKTDRRCNHSTWSLHDFWDAFPWA